MTVSTETARMAKFRPRKNQSERSDLPCLLIMLLTAATPVDAASKTVGFSGFISVCL